MLDNAVHVVLLSENLLACFSFYANLLIICKFRLIDLQNQQCSKRHCKCRLAPQRPFIVSRHLFLQAVCLREGL